MSSNYVEQLLFCGWLRTTKDALLILEAVRRGLLSRVTRRLKDPEKEAIIGSGTVIVFVEEESGIKRWTDHIVWTCSRVLENYLIYREKEDTATVPRFTANDPINRKNASSIDSCLVRAIYGSWDKGQELKVGGLIKKTFSLKIANGTTYHLISYYKPLDVLSGTLKTPSTFPVIQDLDISPELLANVAKLRRPPHIKRDLEGRLTFLGENVSSSSISDNIQQSDTSGPVLSSGVSGPYDALESRTSCDSLPVYGVTSWLG